MNREMSHTVVIDIPQPRDLYKETVKLKRHQKATIKSKLPEKTSSLPTITVIKPVPAITIKKEEILLPYLRYSKKQEKDRFNERLGVGICEDYKIAYTELRKRLYTTDPVDDIRALTDIDSSFFKCVNSDSLTRRYVAPYKSLKYLFNKQLMLKQEIGYRRDCTLNILTNFKKEQDVYDSCVKTYQEQVKQLDYFISYDYTKSMVLLSKSEELKMLVDKKVQELQFWAAEIFSTKSKILGLDYRYGLQKKYGRFLYYLSPPNWRLKNRNFARSFEIEAKGFDFGASSDEDTFNVIFQNIQNECISGLIKPALCFEHPNDLLAVFDGIEQQQQHNFNHVTRLTPHTTFLKKGIKLFKDIIAQESAGVLAVIKKIEMMLLFREEQCSQLKDKFYKIINNSFYEDVGAPEVLKFQLHLEFCHEKVLNEKPMNLGIMATAKALELFYMDYSKQLESMTSSHDIKIAVTKYIEEERLKHRNAKMAAKELRLYSRLEKTLLGAFAPMNSTQNVPIFQTSVMTSLPKKVSRKSTSYGKRRRLTDAELEYLTLFTDWTEKEDPANYMQSTEENEYKH